MKNKIISTVLKARPEEELKLSRCFMKKLEMVYHISLPSEIYAKLLLTCKY